MSLNSEYDCLVSCMLLGKKSVGKSSIICRMLDDEFRDLQETIGMELSSMDTELPNCAKLRVNILDTGGNEDYRDIIVRYFDDVHIVVLVFSMNDITSLQCLTEWNDILKDHGITNESHILIVVGNKLDLLGDVNLNQVIKKTIKPETNFSRRLKSRFANDNTDVNTTSNTANAQTMDVNNVPNAPTANNNEVASWNALEHHNVTEKGKRFAASIGAYYIEVSALSGQNIKSLYSVLPKLAGTFFDIKPRLMKNGKRKKGESSISMLKLKHDDQSCQCTIS